MPAEQPVLFFDILAHVARHRGNKAWVVLYSDCVWTRPADTLLAAIEQHGALTYDIDENMRRMPI